MRLPIDEDERGDAFRGIPKLRLLVVLGLSWGAMGIPKLWLLPLCNIPNFQFGMLYIRSSLHIIFCCIWLDPTNSTQLKDPRRELGIPLFSYLSFPEILKRGSFDFNYFLFEYFFYENKRERIK